jgi:hypothetical protein
LANRCYQLSLEGCLSASYRQTILHFQSGGTNDNDTVAAGESLLAAFDASAKAQFLGTLPTSYSLVRMTARRVALLPSAGTCKYYGFAAQTGTRSGTAAGQQTSPSLFLVPTMGTKSGGRIFWPGILQSDLSQSDPGSSFMSAVNTFIGTLMTGITNAGMTWTLCVYSRKLQTFSNIASHSMSPVVGFIGRRRKPVGAV